MTLAATARIGSLQERAQTGGIGPDIGLTRAAGTREAARVFRGRESEARTHAY